MKRILLALSALLLVAGTAAAQSVETDLVGLGMKPEVASYIATIIPGGSVLGNATYLKARNAANSADISVLEVDANDETILNSDSGDAIVLQSQGDVNRLLTYASTSDTALTLKFGDAGTTATQGLFIGASTPDADDDSTLTLGGGGADGAGRGASIVLAGEDTAGGGDITLKAATSDGVYINLGGTPRAYSFEASSDAAHTIKFGDAGVTATQTLVLSASTSDTDDDSTLSIAAGGAVGTTRGASIVLQGDDVGGAGAGAGVTIEAGTGTAGLINFATAGTTKWKINADGTLDSTLTDVGFRVAAAGNQACTTTCGANKGCVVGLDAGTHALVDCSSALADTCLCTTT